MNSSKILAKNFFDYPGLRDIATFYTPATNSAATNFLDDYLKSKGLTLLEESVNPSGFVRQATYKAEKPFNLQKVKGNSNTTIFSPEGVSAENSSLSDAFYDKLHALKATKNPENIFTRFAGQLTSDPDLLNHNLMESFYDALSYAGNSEFDGLLTKMRTRLYEAANKTGAKLLFVDEIPGGAQGQYFPVGQGSDTQPTILVANTPFENMLLGRKFLSRGIGDLLPQKRKERLRAFQQIQTGYHELGHHLSNIHKHNEAGFPDNKVIDTSFQSFTPSKIVRELHAEPVGAYILQGNNPILPEEVPTVLSKLAFDKSSNWLYNNLPSYSGPTPINKVTESRINIPNRKDVPEKDKPRIRRLAADINADYLTRSDFSNQVQDSVLYYPYLR